MNILFLASWYPTPTNPHFAPFIKEHAKAIKTTENQLVVVAFVVHRSKLFFKKKINDFIDENGIKTVTIEIFTRFRDIVYHAVPLQNFILKNIVKKRLLPDFQIDIIHSNVVFPAGVLGNYLAKYFKKPHIITEHWSGIEKYLKKPIINCWIKKSYKNADAILPVSNFLKNNILRLIPDLNRHCGLDPQSPEFHVIGNIIHDKIFFYKEKIKNYENVKLCAIATWNKFKHTAKQPELFIEGIGNLPKDFKSKIELTIIGGGNMLEEMKQMCERQGINAIFKGALPKNIIAEILQNSDFFVHATNFETFGVVVAEALMTGTPVICSNTTALPELVNETNGILCENTIENWTEAIEKAFSQNFDNQQIANSMRGKFDYFSIGKKFDEVYQLITKH